MKNCERSAFTIGYILYNKQKYSGIQVFSKTKTHGIHKENFYNNIIINIIIGLKLHGLPPTKTTEYLNTRIPPPPGSKPFSTKDFRFSSKPSNCFIKTPYRTFILKKISRNT